MQIRAIARAAQAVHERTGEAPLVEVMHPLVGFREELARLRELTEEVWAEEAPDAERLDRHDDRGPARGAARRRDLRRSPTSSPSGRTT